MTGQDQIINVLFLSDHLGHADGRIHGATSYFLSVLPRLNRDAFAVTVCFLRERHACAGLLEQEGIRPIFLGRGKWDPRAVSDLQRLIRDREIQVVHAAGMKGILAGRYAAHRAGARAVIHLHDMLPQSFPIRTLHRLTAAWTDCALAISVAVGRFAVEHLGVPPDRVRTLYNGVDRSRFAPLPPQRRRAVRASLGLREDTPLVVLVGRLAPVKGHNAALQAMRRVADAVPDSTLLIVGAGPLEEELKGLTQSLRLGAHIRFLGQRPDVPDLVGAADVTLVSSKSEGLSLTAIESLAAGVPIVCPRIGGLPEVVQPDVCGILTEPGSCEEMAGGVIRLLTDKALRQVFAENARNHSLRFDIHRHVTELESVYRQLAGQRA